MKIINNKQPNLVLFETLKCGDVFEWAADFYVKTTHREIAVRLKDGLLVKFPTETAVRPADAVLTIS